MNGTLQPAVRPSRPAKDPVVRWGDFFALPENRSALRAVKSLCRALLARRHPPVIPIVLHGPSGVGKSHLIDTLLKQISSGPDVLTARTVAVGDLARTNAADRSGSGFADRDLTRCDVLMLEDIQQLPARDADAFCELLDRRSSRRKATIVTANVGPAMLRHLPRKLTSRLAAGLVIQLEPLSIGSRRVLVEAAAKTRKLRLTAEALDWLAGQATGGGIGRLLGLLGNLTPAAAQMASPLDRAAVQEILASASLPSSSKSNVARIVKHVAAAYDVTRKELLGPSRLRRVMVPRQVAMYLARELCGLSLPRLGTAFGGRDHTTVLHACRKVAADSKTDASLAGMVRQLRAELT